MSKGTASLYSKDFSMAGKTGTAAVNYAKDGGAGKYYASSFVGYFLLISQIFMYSCSA
jgi:cell division protein FtsI (penicillin-binding protein 3)